MNDKEELKLRLLLIFTMIFVSCAEGQPEIRALDFADFVPWIYGDRRTKSFLVKHPPADIEELEVYLSDNFRQILSYEFIHQSITMITDRFPAAEVKYIEIVFYRVSKELPWTMDEQYIPPPNFGDGNPVDMIGHFLYDLRTHEICYSFVAKRKAGIFNYGEITEEITTRRMGGSYWEREEISKKSSKRIEWKAIGYIPQAEHGRR